jgi:hypothetical protein
VVLALWDLYRQPKTANQGSGPYASAQRRGPYESIAIDAQENLPQSNQGNWYFLITVDYFTKWPEAYAIPNQEAPPVTEALVTTFFCRLGVPRELHSDQGRNFESRLMQEIAQCLGVIMTRTTSPCPQFDFMLSIRTRGIGTRGQIPRAYRIISIE